MSNYKAVSEALAAGANPAHLCGTCPWDRHCVLPPSMTKAEVEAQIAKAKEQDKQAAEELTARGENPGIGAVITTLITSVTIGGRDTLAQVCPVFALRLRSSGGQEIAQLIKGTMHDWDDQR